MHALEQCAQNQLHDELDVTTVYEALRGTSAAVLSDGLMGACGKEGSPETDCSRLPAIAYSRINAMLSILLRLGPDLEASAEPPLDPSSAKSLQSACGKSWQHVLGRRIVLPEGLSSNARAAMLCRVLECMSYL